MSVTKGEMRWAWKWALVIVGLTCLPYLYAHFSTPPDRFYTGLLVNPYDSNSYLAKMRQGMRGEWLFHLPYTSEDHPGAFILTFYLLLGHISSLLSLSPVLVFHLARAGCGLFLLLTVYRFLGLFLEDVGERRMAFLLIGLSSGLGFLAPGAASGADLQPDIYMPEAITFYAIFTNPHFPLAMGLMLLIFAQVAGPEEESRHWKRSLLGGLFSMLLAFVLPFCLFSVAAALGLMIVWRWAEERRFPWKEALRAGCAGLGAAPVLFYDYYVYNFNPALRDWSAQNITPSPPPWRYLLGYGLVLALALAGVIYAARCQKEKNRLLLAWVLSAPFLLYIPFSLQRRLITGLHVPLAILAAVGLSRYISSTRLRKALVALTMPTNLFLLVIFTLGASGHGYPFYLHIDEKRAMDWLRVEASPEEIVLAWPGEATAPGAAPFPGTALFIPVWAGNRVLYGHPFETVKAGEKYAEAHAFFEEKTTAAERERILRENGIDYVFFGPQERKSGADLSGLPFLERVYAGGEVEILRALPEVQGT